MAAAARRIDLKRSGGCAGKRRRRSDSIRRAGRTAWRRWRYAAAANARQGGRRVDRASRARERKVRATVCWTARSVVSWSRMESSSDAVVARRSTA
eukprot:6176114-Pleurochrysis_carterae.AAC.1